VLMRELAIDPSAGAALPSTQEIAATAVRTLSLPDVAALRPLLVPELPVYGMPDAETALAGRADAVAVEDGKPSAVIDWKSEIGPMPEDVAVHTAQLRHYMTAIGVERGALVYMTPGIVRWINA
jgi:hypothetical protein